MSPKGNQSRAEKLLLAAARTFNATLEYDELIRQILCLVMTAVDSEAALIFRIDHNRTNMKVRFTKSDNCDVKVFRLELGQGVVGWVAQYREPLIINDAASDERINHDLEEMADLKFKSVISLPLIGRGQMIGVIEAINSRRGEFTEEDLDILTGLNNQIAVAIDNAHLYRVLKKQAFERQTLYEVGKKLGETLHLDELLHVILDSLRQVVAYNAGGVFLVEPETGEMKPIYAVGYVDEEEKNLDARVGQGLVGHAATIGKAVNCPDVRDDARYIKARESTLSEAAVPIRYKDQVIGVLNVESDEQDAYDQYALALMESYGSQVAISIERARMHEDLLSKRKLEDELNIARTIQQSFLPNNDPIISGYDLHGRNISSEQVGGDYYDFIPIVDGHTGVAIADVSGKGIPAALIMASFRASLIAEIRNNYSIRTIGRKVNSLLCESLKPGNFVTGVYGVLDTRNHILTFSNFGHNPPMLLRTNGDLEFLTEGGPVLGVTDTDLFEERALMLAPGELIVMFTDGVSEVFNEHEEQYGEDRLIKVIRENRDRTARELADAIYVSVRNFAGKKHVFDDLTMVVIKRKLAD